MRRQGMATAGAPKWPGLVCVGEIPRGALNMQNGSDYRDLLPPMPPLLRLPVLGLGTPQAESFGGYLIRLASHQGVSTSALFGGNPDRQSGTSALRRMRLPRSDAQSNLAFSEAGHKAAIKLAERTGDPEVIRLSWYDPRCRVSMFGLWSKTQRWCPYCLETDKIPYMRAIWDFDHVRACPIHHAPLHTECPKCSRTVPKFRTRVAACPNWIHPEQGNAVRCDAPLHMREGFDMIAPLHDQFVADDIGKLVGATSRGDFKWAEADPVLTLQRVAMARGAKTTALQADLFKCSRTDAHKMLTRRREVRLHTALAILFDLGLPIESALLGRPCEPDLMRAVSVHRDVRKPKSVSDEVLKAHMAAIPPGTYPNLHETAAKEGVGIKRLIKEYPHLFGRRAQARRQMAVQKQAAQMDGFRNEVGAILAALDAEGRPATFRSVRSRLSRKGLLANPRFQKEFARLLEEHCNKTAARTEPASRRHLRRKPT